MKPTKKTKRTKGRAMFRDPTAEAYGKLSSFRPQKDYWHTDPVAVIPCATAKEAKAVVKLHGMDEAERVEVAAKAMYHRYYSRPQMQVKGMPKGAYNWEKEPNWLKEDYKHQARAVLSALNLLSK